ncbi:uncharacterized protein BO95DRAFT_238851 [Aspergillus brunneoviolaceus CBS 621.78]|uniref:Uncharacterized protein n=1 Tax=Aspergillus brunneoviolaceus CBS 621.78 TaxID=1450534 RepID=A0ACD1FZ24_9EURO|nr:hypothetical protein BO95DRAFT_238851 [Aspergillus brunneoviolaceus CBS 621.78]RAH42224.1 hypothetical protein BO95DRAFT_238851 [Aspergillus brunneoviolaceus CBS 621.78]
MTDTRLLIASRHERMKCGDHPDYTILYYTLAFMTLMPRPSSLPSSSSSALLRSPSLRRSHAIARVTLARPYHTILYYTITSPRYSASSVLVLVLLPPSFHATAGYSVSRPYPTITSPGIQHPPNVLLPPISLRFR